MIKLIKNDFLFIFKYKIVHVYLFLLLIYSFILMILEGIAFDYAKIYILLSDPLILGFFFIGGILLIEQGEGLLTYQFVSPIKPRDYLISKAIVLAITGSIIAAIISVIRTNALHVAIIASIFLGNAFFSLLGIVVVKKCKNVNDYIGVGMLTTLIVCIPFILALFFPNILFLQYNPVSCVFIIVYHTYFKLDTPLFSYFIGLVLWVLIMYNITYNQFKQYVYGVKQ